MINIFDTHAHYSDEIYDTDRESLFHKMSDEGVSAITLIGASLEDSKKEKEVAIKYRNIELVPKLFYTVGDHPDEIPKFEPESESGTNYLKKLEELCFANGSLDAIAIGEIGLDYHGDFKTNTDYNNQKKWFIAEIDLAKRLNLPIVVHSRDACKDTFDIIKEQAKGMKGIIHCFSYEKEIALDYVKLGFYIGVGGVVTFKNGRKLREVVDSIPIDSIVTETDAPWLSPMPFRGKRNESSHIKYVIEEIAKIKNMSVDETASILYTNALNVYGLQK